MSVRDWLVAAMRLNTLNGFCDVARRNLRTALLSLITIAAMFLISAQSIAVPFDGSATVAGVIEDMWLESDRCIFRISIYWSDGISLDGRSVDAIATFFNESSARYQTIPSSQGWRTGDNVNATLNYTYSEWGEAYWIRLIPKSDENYAEPLSFFERNPFVLYAFVIVIVFVIGQVILLFVFRLKRRRRSGQEEHEIMRFMRRI